MVNRHEQVVLTQRIVANMTKQILPLKAKAQAWR
jgi:hypothetical protein